MAANLLINKNKKINILEISNIFGLGGTEKTLQIYCKHLNKEKFNIFACGFMGSGPREKNIKRYVKKIIIVNGDENKLISFVEENKIDIVHWHSILRDRRTMYKVIKFLEYCKRNKIKVIETSQFTYFDNRIDNLLYKKIFVSKANLIKFYYKYGKKIKNKDEYALIYNPLDFKELEEAKLSKYEISKFKAKLGIKDYDFVIGKMGRADIWKWSDEIIDVVPNLIKEIPNLKVVIRALPSQKLSKIKSTKLEKYFILLPETSNEKELYATYQILDLLVHTSRIGECNSVAINEMMFFGKPVITNSTDFMQFTIFDRDNGQVELIENGKNGFIANSVKEIAKKIIYLRNNKNVYDVISKENTRKAKELFDIENIIKIFDNVILNKNFEHLGRIKTLSEKYESVVIKDSFFRLLKINSVTLFEYIKFIKLKKI